MAHPSASGQPYTPHPSPSPTGGVLVYGLTTRNTIVSFRAQTPGTLVSEKAVTGLENSEDLLGIDIRPATGQLLALGSTSRVYDIDAASGTARPLGERFTPALSGTSFGFDVEQARDVIRVVSDTGLNLRLEAGTGATASVDRPLAYAADDGGGGTTPAVTAAAHGVQLFDVDTARDVLVTQAPPDDGILNTVGALGVDATSAGLDIDAATGAAYAVLQTESGTGFYRVDLSTGAASFVARTASGVEGLAVATPRFLVASQRVDEGSAATVTVRRTGDTTAAASVDVTTVARSATEGRDYEHRAVTLQYAAGENSRTFSVPTTADGLTEGPERLALRLSNPTSGTLLAAAPDAEVTIRDAQPGAAYGVTTSNELVAFSVSTPGEIGSPKQITGLQAGEDIVGIDVRPATEELLALGRSGRLYVVDPATAVATERAVLDVALSGTAFGVDVNPVVDRLRVVSNTGQNLRVVPDTGQTTVDGTLAYAEGGFGAGTAPHVAAAAYTNNTAGATSTELFDLDTAQDAFVRQSPPNDGTLSFAAHLGVAVSDTAATALDISSQGGAIFAVLTPDGQNGPRLYRLETERLDAVMSAARLIGALGNPAVEDFALASVAAPVPPSPSPSPSPSVDPSPTPADPALGLSVTGPGTITPGQRAVLRGTGKPGSLVELRCYSRPSTTYGTARRESLADDGTVQFRLLPGTNTRCLLRYAGSSDTDPRNSRSVVQNVATALSLSVVRNGTRDYTFQGRILPRRAGQLITLYRVGRSGSQVLTSQVRTDSTGTWRIPRRFTGSGTFSFTARTGQNLTNVAGASNVRPTVIF